LTRSALVEAIEQYTRALTQIATLPATPELRREHIKLQVAQLRALGAVKGFAAPETRAAAEKARLLAEQSAALGEPPLRLFSVLLGFWGMNFTAFDGNALREISTQFLTLAEKQGTAAQIMVGHRLVATALLCTGEIARSLIHYNKAIALYDPVQHRPFAARFGQDTSVAALSHRCWALWILGYPNTALEDAVQAVSEARLIGHAETAMFGLCEVMTFYVMSGGYATAKALGKEVASLAEEKGGDFWRAATKVNEVWLYATSESAPDAVQQIASGLNAWRSTGSTMCTPIIVSLLALAHANVRQFDEAWRHIGEAMTTMKSSRETWTEAEVNRIAGEIARLADDAKKAEAYFQSAMAIARQQEAKSWELRAAMSLARLWRDQGKTVEARELLAPVYGWFTEGFDTRDLKEAKALLDQLT
jgi:predicted ATPase